MPSLVTGFEYDIFISYRQKDNKGSHWVTDFVEALKTELGATFKEDISIYFDDNPHDGLLETHNVDKSLEGKLKCLIFIPIISQTYCDPKSFAWQHELCAFNKLVKEDRFGRDIRLTNGNVASRILPIRIHDLDAEDKALLETEIGGVLRSIDFIYREAGVNRPLKSTDSKSDNQNKADYRNQINKVANAVKELIGGLNNRKPESKTATASINRTQPVSRSMQKTIAFASLAVVLFGLAAFIFFYFGGLARWLGNTAEKSIAVLPFKNIGTDGDDEYFSDGMTEEVINYLAKVKELKVISRTSVEQYKGGNKDIPSIANELDVATILQGSVRKAGNKFRISVQLVEAETGFHLWSHEYDKEIIDVLQVQSEIAKEVAEALSIVLSTSEKQTIENAGRVETAAYDYYLKARSAFISFQLGTRVDQAVRDGRLNNSMALFRKAIEADPAFARAYSGLGLAYYNKNFFGAYFDDGFLDTLRILADQALQLDVKNEEAYYLKGIYYHENGKIEEAISEYNKALSINPNFSDVMTRLAYIYFVNKEDPVRGIALALKGVEIDRGPGLATNLRFIGDSFAHMGFFEKAKEYYGLAAPFDGDSSRLYFLKGLAESNAGDYVAAQVSLAKSCQGISADPWTCANESAWILQWMGKYQQALDVRLHYAESTKSTPASQLGQVHRTAWLLWQTGNKEKAREYFDKIINYGTESIRLDRQYAQGKGAQYDLACVYAFTGQKEKAYRYLEECSQLKLVPNWMFMFIKNKDPMFDGLRNEDRYKKILQQVESNFNDQRTRVQQWLDREALKTKVERN